MEEVLKLCNSCKKLLLLTEFTKYRCVCRACRTLYAKQWRYNNSDQHNEYHKNYKKQKYHSDINFKLKAILRARLNKALKNTWKVGSTIELLGCSINELKQHLEAQFAPGMSWDLWSVDGWHIDHKEPLDNFDLTNPEQLKEACNYKNLQPMWSEDNIKKSNKVTI